MNPFTKISAAAASLLVVCGALAWLLTSGRGASVALADVAEVLDKIRSATATATVTIEGKPPVTSKMMFLEPSRFRSESSRGMVQIFGKSQAITLVPEKKFAVVLDLEKVPNDGIAKNWLEDVRQQIRAAIDGPQDEVETLGRRRIDGRDAIGFRLRAMDQEMTVWADPVTALPIRVESTYGFMKPKHQHVMTGFQFNVDIDESLFSLEPPAGYTVQKADMDASTPKEQDLVEVLRVYCAEQGSGLFPPTLAFGEIEKGVTGGIQERIDAKFGDWRADAKLREKVLQSDEYKTYVELGMKLGRGFGFLQALPSEIDWRYAGKGVKLNTPDRPIFWYQPAGSENYRVIYADLTAKEVAVAELKGFPEASGSE